MHYVKGADERKMTLLTWETEFIRTFFLVRKRNLLSVILMKLILTRQQVPGKILMENAACQKCDVIMEIIYYQLKGILMAPSNWQCKVYFSFWSEVLRVYSW